MSKVVVKLPLSCKLYVVSLVSSDRKCVLKNDVDFKFNCFKMLIKSLSVKNYRSIIKTTNLPLGNLSILIGPNNEGKSNILQALILVLKYLDDRDARHRLRRHASGYIPLRLHNRNTFRSKFHRDRSDRISYDWERDFPLKLQESTPDGRSEFSIDFGFTGIERYNFQRKTKIKISKDLRVNLFISRHDLGFKFFDTANLKRVFTSETILKIIIFLHDSISVQYIDTVRTTATTTKVVEEMISAELDKLTSKKEYRMLLAKLSRLQKPILSKLSKNLTLNVSKFLPDIHNIIIDQEENEHRLTVNSCDINIDDGTKTHLELKGDGIKSLLAISIIQFAANQNSLNKSILLAIEEPESHLHPDAIHQLRKILDDISSRNQVIITTHSPLLVSRNNVRKNILVNKSEAKEAENVSEIRKILGVQIADNLHSADLVIMVEGEEDRTILKTWICSLSKKVAKAVESGMIVFDDLGGGSNLSYKINLYKNLLCQTFAFLDDDATGRSAFEDARSKGLITDREACFAKLRGSRESEIEDLVDIDIYKHKIESDFNVVLDGKLFRNNKKKWSDRMKDVFDAQGKSWSERVEKDVKNLVADEVCRTKLKSLKKSCKPSVQTVIRYLEFFLIDK